MRIAVGIEDSRLERYRDLAKARGADRYEVIEGGLLIKRLRQFNVEFVSLLCSAQWAKQFEVLFPPEIPLYVLQKDGIDSVLGFKFHRGCLALVRRPSYSKLGYGERNNDGLLSTIASERTKTVVVASQLSDPVNVGTLIRNAAAFGVGQCLIDETCADPFGRKATRAAMGYNYDGRTYRVGKLQDLLTKLRSECGFRIYATTPGSKSVELSQVQWSMRRVLLFGNEGSGLSQETLELADQCISIPMAAAVDSLNVSSSAAIILYSCSLSGNNNSDEK